jgi:hypothetical protein
MITADTKSVAAGKPPLHTKDCSVGRPEEDMSKKSITIDLSCPEEVTMAQQLLLPESAKQLAVAMSQLQVERAVTAQLRKDVHRLRAEALRSSLSKAHESQQSRASQLVQAAATPPRKLQAAATPPREEPYCERGASSSEDSSSDAGSCVPIPNTSSHSPRTGTLASVPHNASSAAVGFRGRCCVKPLLPAREVDRLSRREFRGYSHRAMWIRWRQSTHSNYMAAVALRGRITPRIDAFAALQGVYGQAQVVSVRSDRSGDSQAALDDATAHEEHAVDELGKSVNLAVQAVTDAIDAGNLDVAEEAMIVAEVRQREHFGMRVLAQYRAALRKRGITISGCD